MVVWDFHLEAFGLKEREEGIGEEWEYCFLGYREVATAEREQ